MLALISVNLFISKLPIPEVPIFLYKPCTDKQPRPADGILTSIEVSDIVLIPIILTDFEFKTPVPVAKGVDANWNGYSKIT